MTRFVQLAQAKRNVFTQRENAWGRFRLSQQKVSLAVFLALIFSALAYLALINNVSTGGFQLKDLEQRIDQLKVENRKLELEATKLEAMNTLVAASEQLELTQADKVEYLEVTSPVVALGR
ncbi:MAG: hypothetical protein WC528_04635 [Patescibacteria group bacterium]